MIPKEKKTRKKKKKYNARSKILAAVSHYLNFIRLLAILISHWPVWLNHLLNEMVLCKLNWLVGGNSIMFC